MKTAAHSGTYFNPSKPAVTAKHNPATGQRGSIYLSSDSSDDFVRGELRRGSAPL